MTIIEADGSNTEPLDVDSVTILTGMHGSFSRKALSSRFS